MIFGLERPPHVTSAVVAWIVSVLGWIGLIDTLGLTAGDAATIIGAIVGAGSTIYAVVDARRRGASAREGRDILPAADLGAAPAPVIDPPTAPVDPGRSD